MKRFLLIFLISLSGLVVTVGAVLGVQYLTGKFDEPVIAPESINFEQSDYYFDGTLQTNKWKLTITAPNEDVTQNKVSLVLSSNCEETEDRQHWTDGIIIIPKHVKLGEEFEVELVKDKSHKELGDEEWIHGGVSTIIAKTEEGPVLRATTNIFVDVPVKETELVIYNGEVETTASYLDALKDIEYSGFANPLNGASVRAGDEFYIGVKFYPAASAIKYSQFSSSDYLQYLDKENRFYPTSILFALKDKICSQSNISQAELFEAYSNLFSGDGTVGAKEFLSVYESIVKNDTVTSNNLSQFNSFLKYINIFADSTSNFEIIEVLPGTNIFKVKASQTLGNSDFYSYTFINASSEEPALKLIEDGLDEVSTLKNLADSGLVYEDSATCNTIDLEVDSIELGGSMSTVYTNLQHTIYASKNGANNKMESYLRVKLYNSNIPSVDLQDKISNFGIRFEKKNVGTDWQDVTGTAINLVGTYEDFEVAGYKYYKPIGDTSAAWVISAGDEYVGNYRIVMAYYAEATNVAEKIAIVCSDYLVFSVLAVDSSEEKMLSWTSTDDIELSVISVDINGDGEVDDRNEPTFDLSQFIDSQTVANNVYSTVRYFIYTTDEDFNATENSLSTYFDVKNVVGVEYEFGGTTISKLYELSSSTLAFKDITNIPNVPIYVIYATVKSTMLADGRYDIVKFSAIKEGLTERLSSLRVVCSKSLTNIYGAFSITDNNNAQFVYDDESELGTLKLAQNTNDILKITIASNDPFDELAVGGKITIVSTYGEDKVVADYITASYVEESYVFDSVDGVYTADFNLSTEDINSLGHDIEIELYIVYIVGGNNYFFKLDFEDVLGDIFTSDDISISIIYDTNKSAGFAFDGVDSSNELDHIEISTQFNDNTKLIETIYTFVFADEGTEAEIVSRDKIFASDEDYLLIDVFNFLKTKIGDQSDSNDYYLRSSNESIIKLSEGKKLTIAGETGSSVISLYVYGVDDLQDSIKIEIKNTGSIAYYVINDSNNTKTKVDGASYNGGTINLSVEVTTSDSIYLTDGDENGENTSLFTLYYEIGETINKLEPNITLSENALVDLVEDGDGYSYIKLTKNLGDGITITLNYDFEAVGIKQKVALSFLPTIKVTEVLVEDNSTSLTANSNGVYEVYAGYGYDISASLSTDGTAYFFDADGYKFANETNYSFKDVARNTELTLFIRDKNDDAGAGDLNHKINFLVKPNVKLTKSEETVVLDDNGSASISISDIMERVYGLKEFDYTQFEIYSPQDDTTPLTSGEVYHLGDNDSISISLKNSVSKIVNVNVRYAGYSLGTLKITINVKNYEKNDNNRIYLYNGELAVLLYDGIDEIDNDGTPLTKIKELFEGYNGIEVKYDAQYVQIIGGTKRVHFDVEIGNRQNADIFKNIGTKVTVYDGNGNYTDYLIVISKFELQMVQFVDNYNRELDLYKAYNQFGEDLALYYEQMSLSIDENYYGDGVYDLSDAFSESLYNISDTKISYQLALVNLPGENINNYALESNGSLNLYDVGFNYYLQVTMTLTVSSTFTYRIRAILYVQQSQYLKVNYIYDDNAVISENYGTESYDAGMLEGIETFNNIPMEYASFVGINSIATFDLTQGQLSVTNKDYNPIVYSGSWNVEVESVAISYDGNDWLEVSNKDAYESFIRVNNLNSVEMFRYNYDTGISVYAIRAKLKISLTSGAYNYYYLQAGGVPSLWVYKNDSRASGQPVNASEQVEASRGDVIRISAESVSDGNVNYYLQNCTTEESQKYLSYKLYIDGQKSEISNYFNESDDKTLTVKIVPSGATVQLVLYTMYGDIATVNVTINAYYTAEFKDLSAIYGGKEYAIGDFISLTDADGTSVTGFTVEDFNTDTENIIGVYKIKNNNVIFSASATEYTLDSFSCTLTIVVDGDTYKLNFTQQNVVISPIIEITNFSFTEPKTENNGKINIEGDAWSNIFDIKDGDIGTLSATVTYTYDGETEPASFGSGIELDIGTIIAQTTVNVTFKVTITNFDGSLAVFTATKTITVLPQFIVSVNYPSANTEGEVCEYVQVGATVDFSSGNAGKNFNGNMRVSVVSSENYASVSGYDLSVVALNGAVISADDGAVEISNQKVTFKQVGSYYVHIKIDGVVYGRYRVEVLYDSPFSFDTTKIDDEVFYAQNGIDNVLYNYFITYTLPNIERISDGDNYNIYFNDLMIVENAYWFAENKNAQKQLSISLELYAQYAKNVNSLYVKYDDANYEISTWKIEKFFGLQYNGEEVSYAYYTNIFDAVSQPFGVESRIDLNGNEAYTVTVKLTLNVDSVDKNTNQITCTYAVIGNITVNRESEDEDYDITLNANQYDAGLSLVDMFDIKDQNGNKIWYNEVGTYARQVNGGNSSTLELNYVSTTAAGFDQAIRTEALELHEGSSNSYVYDYNLKALGACNDGTIVTYKLVYTFASFRYEKTIKIRVISDIEYVLYNNDGTSTENGSSNTLILEDTGDIIISNATRANADDIFFYVYAYGKYTNDHKNIATSMYKYQIGDGSIINDTTAWYTEVKTSNGNLVLKYSDKPSFGNKSLELVFTDNFGFTFSYYITLVAEVNISSYSVSNEQVFEGDSLVVYNKKVENANGDIGITLTNGMSTTDFVTDNIEVSEASAIVKGKTEAVSIDIVGAALKFGFAEQDFWDTYGSRSVALVVTIKVNTTGSQGDESAAIIVNVNYTRRYETVLNPENTYVRDGVPFQLETMVDVRDYKNGYYLGVPTLETYDAININLKWGGKDISSGSIEFDYKKNGDSEEMTYYLKPTTGNVFNILTLMGNYDNATKILEQLGEIVSTKPDDTGIKLNDMGLSDEDIKGIASAILNVFNISYNSANENFNLAIVVRVIEKSSTENYSDIYHNLEVELNTDSTQLSTVANAQQNYIILDYGDFKEVNPSDYNFEYYYSVSDSMTDIFIFESYKYFENILTNTATIKLTALNIATSGDVTVYIDIGEVKLVSKEVKPVDSNKPIFVLESAGISNVSLYTGGYEEETEGGETYYKKDASATNSFYLYNGMTLDDIRIAKNISGKITLRDSNENEIGNTMNLTADGTFSTSSVFGVIYQTIFGYIYKVNLGNGITYTSDAPINVTLKYTGIDTSSAYVGTSEIFLFELDSTVQNSVESTEGGTYKVKKDVGITIELQNWSKDFTLIPGVGKAKELAINGGEDLSFNGNGSILSFTLKAIDNSGNPLATNVASIDENGNITLKTDFNLDLNYISIAVNCKYPNNGELSESKEIGVIYVGFKYVAS